jgi:hypothetical protein
MIPKLDTATEAVNYWAEHAADWDELANHLENVLPRDSAGDLPFGEETMEALREKLEEVALAAATALGYYSKNVWVETKTARHLVPHGQPTYPARNGYPQRY